MRYRQRVYPREKILEISARLIEDEDIRRIVLQYTMRDTPEKDVMYGPPYDQRRNKAGKKRRTRAERCSDNSNG